MQAEKGFTIVELLIVIVVIAILATITIVSYNGVQNRAKSTAAQKSASTVRDKAEAYNALNSTYPVGAATSAAMTTTFNSTTESALTGTGVTLAATPTAANGQTTVRYAGCSNGAGYTITYWDYTAGTLSGTLTGGATCTLVTVTS